MRPGAWASQEAKATQEVKQGELNTKNDKLRWKSICKVKETAWLPRAEDVRRRKDKFGRGLDLTGGRGLVTG